MGLKNQTIIEEVSGILADAFAPGESRDFQRGVAFALKSLAHAIRKDSENLADRILEQLYAEKEAR